MAPYEEEEEELECARGSRHAAVVELHYWKVERTPCLRGALSQISCHFRHFQIWVCGRG